jgi:hypothetical protein
MLHSMAFEPFLLLQNVGLELQYKTCYARVLDSKRKFLQAATQYYELSQVENVRSGPGQVCMLRASAGLISMHTRMHNAEDCLHAVQAQADHMHSLSIFKQSKMSEVPMSGGAFP